GYVIPNVSKRVNLDEKTFKSFKLEKGDILFNRTNAYELVGRTGIFLLDGNYVFASYLIRLRPKSEVFDPHFLTYYLIFSHERLRQLATRAVHQANINATNLKKVKIPRPPLKEQQKIAQILSTVDKKLELERNEKAKLERIKQALMDLLLTGKIRVKV
ncbi:MAG TPA: restriction endonuclease subunit S, partial [Candidatus Aenigmarchaeota archaeon]|nr:restriction endonuclease subunit S [Candidatus Aenigmarchaeota archaeon]